MKKFYKIEDFIDTTSNAFALKGTSPLSADATEATMCSSANVLAEIEGSFGERSIYVKETETPMASFAAMWARWLSRRGNMLAAAWATLNTQYKPLDNYDRHEDGTDTTTITPAEVTHTTTPAETTETITPAETTTTTTPAETTVTSSPAETTVTTTPAETTNTEAITNTQESPGRVSDTVNKVYPFNSSSAVPVSEGKTTTTGETTNALTVNEAGTEALTVQTAGSEAVTVQHAGTDSVTVQQAGSNVQTVQSAGLDILTVQEPGSESTTYGHHVYGNAGTTMTQTMAEAEVSLRQKDMIYKAIAEFISLYTVYV